MPSLSRREFLGGLAAMGPGLTLLAEQGGRDGRTADQAVASRPLAGGGPADELEAAPSGPIDDRTFERSVELLDGRMDYASANTALCTHGSWFGLVKADRLGLEAIHQFYGRKPALLSPDFLTFDVQYASGGAPAGPPERVNGPLAIQETDGSAVRGVAAFCASDILCYHLSIEPLATVRSVEGLVHLPKGRLEHPPAIQLDPDRRCLIVRARMPKTDKRDPHPEHPFTLALRWPKGWRPADPVAEGTVEPDGLRFRFACPADALVGEHTFVLGIGEGETADEIVGRMAALGELTSRDSLAASRAWLRAGLGRFSFEGVPARYHAHQAMAACQLLSNTKAPRGRLRRRALFPSRGTYCSHYLWDTCFSTVGLATFNEPLAREGLLNLVENQEDDGKIPQFICSSWNRPEDSQPPLIGWAAWRLYERTGERELIERVYEPLCRMVEWWFAKRDADRDGLVEYLGRLEAGWDNSPRFERGPIAGADLNGYLNQEMQVLGRMADVLGQQDAAAKWQSRHEAHGRLMLERLYDPGEGLFFDRLIEGDRLNRLKTPACFIPLWCGVPLEPGLARRMVERHLLNPAEFFGPYPFGVVARDEPSCDPGDWWRGPVWINVAWMMVEVLRRYGYEDARREATRRLVEMIAADLSMAELYDSASGAPLGCHGYGWTCALFMDLVRTVE